MHMDRKIGSAAPGTLLVQSLPIVSRTQGSTLVLEDCCYEFMQISTENMNDKAPSCYATPYCTLLSILQ